MFTATHATCSRPEAGRHTAHQQAEIISNDGVLHIQRGTAHDQQPSIGHDCSGICREAHPLLAHCSLTRQLLGKVGQPLWLQDLGQGSLVQAKLCCQLQRLAKVGGEGVQHSGVGQ